MLHQSISSNAKVLSPPSPPTVPLKCDTLGDPKISLEFGSPILSYLEICQSFVVGCSSSWCCGRSSSASDCVPCSSSLQFLQAKFIRLRVVQNCSLLQSRLIPFCPHRPSILLLPQDQLQQRQNCRSCIHCITEGSSRKRHHACSSSTLPAHQVCTITSKRIEGRCGQKV